MTGAAGGPGLRRDLADSNLVAGSTTDPATTRSPGDRGLARRASRRRDDDGGRCVGAMRRVGADMAEAKSTVDSRDQVVEQLQRLRDQVSGVSVVSRHGRPSAEHTAWQALDTYSRTGGAATSRLSVVDSVLNATLTSSRPPSSPRRAPRARSPRRIRAPRRRRRFRRSATGCCRHQHPDQRRRAVLRCADDFDRLRNTSAGWTYQGDATAVQVEVGRPGRVDRSTGRRSRRAPTRRTCSPRWTRSRRRFRPATTPASPRASTSPRLDPGA